MNQLIAQNIEIITWAVLLVPTACFFAYIYFVAAPRHVDEYQDAMDRMGDDDINAFRAQLAAEDQSNKFMDEMFEPNILKSDDPDDPSYY